MVWIALCLAVSAGAEVGGAQSEDAVDGTWRRAADREDALLAWSVYVEREPRPGRPAFRIETRFAAPPSVAAATLMESMAEDGSTTRGERRRLLERKPNGALVHTYIDLPFMFADRELAIRVTASRDAATGIHRIEWVDANEHLPPPAVGVLRLQTKGYWEFRPDPIGGTRATYVSRAEVGGSLPLALQDRLMRGQAEDAVKRLARSIGERGTVQVAAPPPGDRTE